MLVREMQFWIACKELPPCLKVFFVEKAGYHEWHKSTARFSACTGEISGSSKRMQKMDDFAGGPTAFNASNP